MSWSFVLHKSFKVIQSLLPSSAILFIRFTNGNCIKHTHTHTHLMFLDRCRA